jgi:hypothetical protein
VLIRRVVRYEVQYQFHSALVNFGKQLIEVSHGAEE